MTQKKVLCCQFDLPADVKLSDILLHKKVKGAVVGVREKSIEISHVTEDKNLILGLFVTTQVTKIPPIHKPGDESDYSAVDLGFGKGLAYPNVFLFDKNSETLFWEVNRLGITENYICDFFESIASKIGVNHKGFYVTAHPLFSKDAYSRISKMMRIEEVELQIVNPLIYMRGKHDSKSVEYIAKTAESLKATKSINITLACNDYESLNKNGILNLARLFSGIGSVPTGRKKNKLLVRGIKDEEGQSVEEAINYMTDRLYGHFMINEPRIASSLQIRDRKSGIKEVYNNLKSDIYDLVGDSDSANIKNI